MAQPSGTEPEWIALHAKHQKERTHFARKVAADRQELERRIEAETAELLTNHAQQERDYWFRHHLKTRNTSSQPRATHQPVAPNTQSTTSKLDATPAHAPFQRPVPAPGPPRTQQSARQPPVSQLKSDCQQPNGRTSTSASAPHSLRPQPAPKKKCEIVDLCSDDDDVLVEVTEAAYKKNVMPAVTPAPFRPSIPTATLQLFGEKSQKQFLTPEPSPIKRENSALGEPAHNQTQPYLPQAVQHVINKSSTTRLSTQPHHHVQNHDSAALNPLSSIVSQRAASAIPLHQQGQTLPNNFTINHATLPANRDLSMLDQNKQSHSPKNERGQNLAKNLGNAFASKGDDDVDIEDVPLALINIKAVLKKMGVTTSKADDTAKKVLKPGATCAPGKTHLPSPSPSLASACRSATPKATEAATLLATFKKPALPQTTESRVSSYTRPATSLPDKTSHNREGSVASRSSNLSSLSKKRKAVNMSDDEQSNYEPSEYSPFTERKKTTISLGSPCKEPRGTTAAVSKLKGPSPSTSSLSRIGKNTNGFGPKLKSMPVSPSTPIIAPRTPTKRSTPSTPQTPTPTSLNKRFKLSTTPSTPGKRNAAVKAQECIQQICEADEEFTTADQIFQASTKEARRDGTSTAHLRNQLRSMSITPVPTGVRSSTLKDTRMSDALNDTGATIAESTDDKDGVYTREKWLKDRAAGDRLAARNRRVIDEDSDEDYDDLDISEYSVVNGIIVQTGEQRTLTADVTG